MILRRVIASRSASSRMQCGVKRRFADPGSLAAREPNPIQCLRRVISCRAAHGMTRRR